MAEKLEAREKETAGNVEIRHTDEMATVTHGNADIRVESHVFTLHPIAEGVESEAFTSKTFEDALDRVSRPVKGKYAHIPYSSEDFIRDKRKEVELEER